MAPAGRPGRPAWPPRRSRRPPDDGSGYSGGWPDVGLAAPPACRGRRRPHRHRGLAAALPRPARHHRGRFAGGCLTCVNCGSVDIRDVTSDDLDAVLDLRNARLRRPDLGRRAGALAQASLPALAEGRSLGVFDGPRLVATARLRPFTQWWHGKPQPMAGSLPSPSARRIAARASAGGSCGPPWSGPSHSATPSPRSTRRPRRSTPPRPGDEHAGARHRVHAPAPASLRTIPADRPRSSSAGWVPATRPRWSRCCGGTRRRARLRPVSGTSAPGRRWLGDGGRLPLPGPGRLRHLSLGRRGHRGRATSSPDSEETARALWSLVGSASSMAEHVTATVAPDDPVLWLTARAVHGAGRAGAGGCSASFDVAAAVERRGYPAAVVRRDAGSVQVADRLRPGNTGRWRLEFSGGAWTAPRSARARRGLPGASCRSTASPALYAGIPAATLPARRPHVRARTLRRAARRRLRRQAVHAGLLLTAPRPRSRRAPVAGVLHSWPRLPRGPAAGPGSRAFPRPAHARGRFPCAAGTSAGVESGRTVFGGAGRQAGAGDGHRSRG